MIIMALVTTIMTGPALDLINKIFPDKIASPGEEDKTHKYRILISFGNPDNGKVMLRMVNYLIKKNPEGAEITALHLSPSNDLHKYNIEEYEKTSFLPVFKQAGELNLKINTIFKASQDIEKDIIETANSGSFDFLIAGKAHSIYEGSILGKLIQIITRITNPGRIYGTIKGEEKLFHRSVFDGQTRRLLKSVKIPMSVLIDNGFSEIKSIIVPFYSRDDIFIIAYADKLLSNSEAMAYIYDGYNLIYKNDELKTIYDSVLESCKNKIEFITSFNYSTTGYNEHELLLLSLDGWYRYVHDNRSGRLPTTLIIKP